MRVLVLGGCGFIGSHLVDELLAAGHDVSILDPSPSPVGVSWHGVRHVRCNQANAATVKKALAAVDVVYHVASSTVPGTSMADPARDIEENLMGIVRFVETMRETPCRRIVYFSSGGTVYGESDALTIAEDHALDPICSYGMVKVAAEKYLGICARTFGLRPLIIRAANVYGPRQRKTPTQGLVAACISNALSGEPMEIWGDGLAVRDYVYVGDITRLARKMGESAREVGIFNAGSGTGTTVNQVLHLVSEISSRKLLTAMRPARQFDCRHVVLSIDRASTTFDWRPAVTLREGIARTWSYFLDEEAAKMGRST